MSRDWDVGWHSPDIYPTQAILTVYEYPWWAAIPERVFDSIDVLLRHSLCNPPEWTFKVPLSLQRDEDGWTQSLGWAIWKLFQVVGRFLYDHRVNVHKVDLTDEWLIMNGFENPLGDDDE